MDLPSGAQPTQQPIAVIDSGVGGLSVWREVVALLPAESTVYLADQAHLPYGPRSIEEIRRFVIAITESLLGLGAKLIVVACNTASGAALTALREMFPGVPFVGMEPAVKPAVERTRSGVVGVLATPTTFQGDLYRRLADRFGKSVAIHTQTCPGLVEAIECGEADSPQTEALLKGCLAPLIGRGIDQLVLGCTHYPFASDVIATIVGSGVGIIDPAPAVARQVRRVLGTIGALAPEHDAAGHVFVTTGSAGEFAEQLTNLIGVEARATAAVWEGSSLRIGYLDFKEGQREKWRGQL